MRAVVDGRLWVEWCAPTCGLRGWGTPQAIKQAQVCKGVRAACFLWCVSDVRPCGSVVCGRGALWGAVGSGLVGRVPKWLMCRGAGGAHRALEIAEPAPPAV